MMEKSIRSRKLFALVIALVFVLTILAGCSNGGDSSTGGGDASSGSSGTSTGGGSADALPPANGADTLTVALVGEPPTLAPTDHNSQMGEMFNMQMYNSLFYVDDDYNLINDLIEDYENTSETEWTFTLKQGVKFHDGTEMHAEDVVASIEKAQKAPQVARFSENFASIEEVDEYTVKITTDGPYSEILYDLSHTGNSICPKALIDAGHDFNAEPCGTGPYMYKDWVLGDRVELTRFDDYHDEARKAKIKDITFRFIPEGSSRTIALEAGEIDVIHVVEFMDLDKLETNPAFEVLSRETCALRTLGLNNEKEGLDNKDFRMALNHAIDRQLVMDAVLNGRAITAATQVPLGMPGSSDEGALPYDLDKANEYLEKSGVDPTTLGLSIVCADDAGRRMAEVVQAAWAEIGVPVEIEMMELATMLTTTAEGNFTVTAGGYSTKSLLSWIKSVFGESSIGAVNKSRINDPEINAQIKVCEQTMDENERIKELEKLSQMCNETATQVGLYQEIMYKVYNANLMGIAMSPNGTVYYNLVEWAA